MQRAERRRRLDQLASEASPFRRKMIALSLLTDRLAEDGIVPILVGGTALSVYTAGGYETKDVDLALPIAPEVDRAFDELGFRKAGRYWIREELDLLFEAPARGALPDDLAPLTEIDVDGLRVVVIGLEDLLLDRVRAWVYWKSDEDRRWSLRLVRLWNDRIDRSYLRRRANAEELSAMESLFEESAS